MKKSIVFLLFISVFLLSGCDNRRGIIPETPKNDVEEIKLESEYKKDGVTYTLSEAEDCYIVSGLNDENVTDVKIYSSINNLPVYEIKEKAFEDCQDIKTVTIEEGIKIIGNYAFSDATILESIKLPDSLEEIGAFAFANCYRLLEIRIPDKVKRIEDWTFSDSELISIVLGRGIEWISDTAFSFCNNITVIYNLCNYDFELLKENGVSNSFSSINNAKVILYEDEEKSVISRKDDYVFANVKGTFYLVDYLGNERQIVLPNDFEYDGRKIDKYIVDTDCFSFKYAMSLVIPKSVIRFDGFLSINRLEEIYNLSPTIDIEIRNDGTGYVDSSEEIQKITADVMVVHNDLSEESIIKKNDSYYYASSGNKCVLLEYLGNDKDIKLPETIIDGDKVINNYSLDYFVFWNCISKVNSIEIPESVTYIGSSLNYVFNHSNVDSNGIIGTIIYHGTLGEWKTLGDVFSCVSGNIKLISDNGEKIIYKNE